LSNILVDSNGYSRPSIEPRTRTIFIPNSKKTWVSALRGIRPYQRKHIKKAFYKTSPDLIGKLNKIETLAAAATAHEFGHALDKKAMVMSALDIFKQGVPAKEKAGAITMRVLRGKYGIPKGMAAEDLAGWALESMEDDKMWKFFEESANLEGKVMGKYYRQIPMESYADTKGAQNLSEIFKEAGVKTIPKTGGASSPGRFTHAAADASSFAENLTTASRQVGKTKSATKSAVTLGALIKTLR
jgi:hypothetical protein